MAQLCVALDFAAKEDALALVKLLSPDVRWFKVGMELFDLAGPGIISEIRNLGAQIFLDLKLHDIPRTVERTAAVLAKLGAGMFNVHASGGRAMLSAAKRGAARGAREAHLPAPHLVGVTVLTSLDQEALSELGVDSTPQAQVLRLAALCDQEGLDGVVCSPLEAGYLREKLGKKFLLVTPGIRPAESALEDQRRIATPGAAVRSGADFLVVGRPIARAGDPRAAALEILAEMRGKA
jgi:orotidine-5'-phosphate decarboxylase